MRIYKSKLANTIMFTHLLLLVCIIRYARRIDWSSPVDGCRRTQDGWMDGWTNMIGDDGDHAGPSPLNQINAMVSHSNLVIIRK
jgi:hypothetical protein